MHLMHFQLYSYGISSTAFTFGLVDRHLDWKWFFCPHLWQICPLAGQWRFPCWYPQNLHSGRWRGGSRGLRAFGGGSVLTAPTDSSVPLVIKFNCWLVCSEALQMSIALDKVRSFTRKRRLPVKSILKSLGLSLQCDWLSAVLFIHESHYPLL